MSKIQRTGPKKISVLYPVQNIQDTNDSSEKKLRVAAYCRVSSGSDEQLTSYNAQIGYYEKYIKEKDEYTYVGIYADEGISGTDLKKRDAFNRMMQDARDGKIDMIITKSLSRFGRNTLYCLNCIRELKALGVDVYFEKENIHTMKNEGELLLTLISATAQQESQAQSDNIRWGIRRKYERGHVKSIPSGKFLGYDKDKDGNLIINEVQAEVVRRIYREFLDGYGTYQIAKRFTDEKIPMAYGGKEWCTSHIRKVLMNEKMKGDTQFQKTYNADYLTKRRVKNTGELPQHYLEDTHPAIIDKNTWELVQLEMARQERYCEEHHISKYHNNNERHPLSARITCSTCGCTFMSLYSNRVGEEGRQYWRCSSYVGKRGVPVVGHTFTPKPNAPRSKETNNRNAKRRKSPKERQMLCTDVEIPAEALERAVVEAWNSLVDNRDAVKRSLYEDDALKAYRAREFMKLLDETGYIESMLYELMLKTMERIEVGHDGRLTVVFFEGGEFDIVYINKNKSR